MISEMETTLNGSLGTPSNPKKGSTCNLLLKNLILKETNEKVIDDFYNPNLKLYVYPLIWSNYNAPIQYPSMDNDEWSESARMILSENNSRELIEGNLPMVSLPIEAEDFEINLLLLAITFKDKGIIKYKIFDKIKQVVKKSDLNKLIKQSSQKNAEKIEQCIEKLRVNLLKLSEYLNSVECLVRYHSKSPKPETIITLCDKSLQTKISIEMKGVDYERFRLAERTGMPDLNGTRLLYERTRGSLDDLEKAIKPVHLINSVSGDIESILFALPATSNGIERENYLNVVRELVKVMPGVKVIILIEMDKDETDAEDWEKQVEAEIKSLEMAIPSKSNTTIEVIERNIRGFDNSFTVWAQDALIPATGMDNTKYLLTSKNSKRQDRRNDGSIASRVAESNLGYTLRPFNFQLEGGNVLVADDFILIGKDEVKHNGDYTTENDFLNKFKRYIGDKRKVIFIEVSDKTYEKPKEVVFSEEKERTIGEIFKLQTYYHRIYKWRGLEQPIFHIDVFMTLLGYNEAQEYELLIGEPVAGFDYHSDEIDDEIRSVFYYQLKDAQERINECIEQLTITFEQEMKQSLKIHRNPLPLTFYNAGLNYYWYWATYNNCLIQNGKHKTVWLPTYGHHDKFNPHWSHLKQYDEENKKIFKKLGFNPHLLNTDFNFFAQKNGSLHCLSKSIERTILLT